MDATLMTWVHTLLAWFSLPEVGLGAVFLVSVISATLLPLGSEPAVYALVSLKPDLFWPTIAVATAGNTLGGAISWWMGRAAHRASDRLRHLETEADLPPGAGQAEGRAARWLSRFGPVACLLSWLPVVGDPLCAVAGWLRMPFWPCVAYMAIGKALRYLTMTAWLLWMI